MGFRHLKQQALPVAPPHWDFLTGARISKVPLVGGNTGPSQSPETGQGNGKIHCSGETVPRSE